MCCCSGPNNCCGATCFNNDAIFKIYPYEKGVVNYKETAGTLQKTFGVAGAGAICRCCLEFSNYVIEFPEQADVTDKGLFLTAFVNTEYVFMEKNGDNS